MKKLFLIFALFVCLFSFALQAKEVNKQTAEKIAANAFAKLDNNKNIVNFQVKEVLTVYSDDIIAFYIVNFKPTGFIILSASDATMPILGSSTESNFLLENLPPQLDYLLNCYKTQIKEVEKQKIVPTEEIKLKWDKYSGKETTGISSSIIKSATTLPSQVSPLVTTTWGQDAGYNRFCPVVNSGGSGGYAFAGCVATAMAQILKYWGCKVNESKTHSYKPANYDTLSVDFNVADYQWNLMGNTPSDQYNAQLIRDCGVAVDMNYGPIESGAPLDLAQYAFSYYFGFKNTSVYAPKSGYADDTAWKNALKQDLCLGRPILYGGSTSGTSPKLHVWVIDGYDSNDNFHCNWGNGVVGAYYPLTYLCPSTLNYNISQLAILNLEPVMSDCSEINGSTTICISGASFNVPNLPAGATVTWDKSSNITFNNQPGNPKTFIANGSGFGWIEATVHYNGDATLNRKTVWLGSPSTPTEINGFGANGIEFGQNSTYEFNVYPPTIEGITNYQWQVGGGTILSGQGTSLISVRTASNPNGITKYFNVSVRVANSCGWSSYLYRSGFIGTGIGPSLLISPNPATSETTVELVYKSNVTSNETTLELANDGKAVSTATTEWDLEVYDPMQSMKEKKTKIKTTQTKINTTNWKDGVYIIRAIVNDGFVTGKLIVKH